MKLPYECPHCKTDVPTRVETYSKYGYVSSRVKCGRCGQLLEEFSDEPDNKERIKKRRKEREEFGG